VSNAAPTTSLPPGQANKLAVLLDALGGVALSDGERASLTWLAGFERPTVGNVTALITRVVGTGGWWRCC
jgi:hypothetical protein